MTQSLPRALSTLSIVLCLVLSAQLRAQDLICPPGTVPITPGNEDDFVDLFDAGGGGYCTPYNWMVRADGLFLTRRAVDGEQSLAFGNAADPKGTEVINTGDLDFAHRWGPRISLTRCFSDVNSVEFSYFQIDGWNSTATRTGAISVQFPSFAHPPLPVGAPFGVADFNYSSRIYNGEANLRHMANNGWLTWIVGFRYLELSEDYGAVFNTGGGTSRYNIGTNNNLVGFQIGSEAHIWQRGNWSVDGWLKAGVFGNSARSNTFEDVAAIGGGTATASATRDQTAFLGELGLAAVFQLTERVGIRAGYQIFWLDRVALAPEQLDNVNPAIPLATVDLAGDLILHGGFVGFEGIF